jgi:glyoxylase-like metal-dependent hydrolase (beta-lactamase superfamily II)
MLRLGILTVVALVTVLATALAPRTVSAQAAAPAAPAREVVQLRGDLYFVRGGTHNTVAYVTPDGIILGDPISTEVATWLKAELQRRFNKPVVHIVYSHHDFDHAEGAAVFGQATIWAHENVVKNLDGRLHRLAGGFTDANGNGRLERAEAGGGYGRSFDRLDRNKDGAITPAEMNQEIVKPSRTYSDRTTVTLGGKTVQLIHPGRNHSDDMTVMFFPAERVAFGVDFLAPGTTPSAAGNYDGTPLVDWIASIKAVEALDIDVFAPGHGRPGTKADITMNRRFLEDVAAAVQQGISEGRDLDELKKSITLDAYAVWPNLAATRASHIESAFNNLAASPDQFRSELSVSVLGSVSKPGMYRVKKGMPIRDLLQIAGGTTDRANLAGLRIMRIVGFNRREYDVKAEDTFLHNDTIIVPVRP